MEEDEWAAAVWSEYFIDIRNSTYPAPEHDTRFKMMWDDSFLYVGAWLEEPHIHGHLYQRDTVIFWDNDFEIFIDPDGDHHDYGELEVNALNTHWDLVITEPYEQHARVLDAWDIRGLKKAVGVYGTLNDPSDTDSCWVVEWAIPMLTILEMYTEDSLPKAGISWKVNFSRVQWPLSIENGRYKYQTEPWAISMPQNWVWSPQHVINLHHPEQWGIVTLVSEAMPIETMPDTLRRIEQVRSDVMRVFRSVRDLKEESGVYPESLDAVLPKVELRATDPDLMAYRRNLFGFELTCPIDSERTARVTESRQFVVMKKKSR